MNKPAKVTRGSSPAYDADGYGWAVAQAAMIRAGRFEEVDWENVAEEIDGVGKSEQSKGESALRVLMAHILKWQLQPDRRGRSWMLTILEQRVRYDEAMVRSPSLKAKREEMRQVAYRRSRIEAAREMDVDLATLPPDAPDWSVILDEPFEI